MQKYLFQFGLSLIPLPNMTLLCSHMVRFLLSKKKKKENGQTLNTYCTYCSVRILLTYIRMKTFQKPAFSVRKLVTRKTLQERHYSCTRKRGVSPRHSTISHSVKLDALETEVAPSWPTREAIKTAFGSTTPERSNGTEAAQIRGDGLPEWLKGTYFRNGPGCYENGSEKGMIHMFDGYGMIVKVELNGEENSAHVGHAFVQSEAFSEYKKTNKMRWREFGTPKPQYSIADRCKEIFEMILGSVGMAQGETDNASVNVIPRGDGVLWAMTETVRGTYVMDPESLETKQRVQYSDGIFGSLTTAHPLKLPGGELVNFLSVPGDGFHVYHVSGDDDQTCPMRREIASINHFRPLSPAWIHDMPGTKEHVVIVETPLYFNLGSLMSGVDTSHMFLDWIPSDGTRIHVVELATGKVHTAKTAEAFFVFHYANAFTSDGGNCLHIDAAVYDDPDIVTHLKLESVRAPFGSSISKEVPRSSMRRLTLKKTSDGEYEIVKGDNRSCWTPLSLDEAADFGNFADFPVVNPNKKGEEHRYIWCAAAKRPTNVTNALVKFDTYTQQSAWWHQPGALPGEPCFIPKPDSTEEDDGVVLSMVTDPSGASVLVVLDASSMIEIARVVCPYSYTSGFHGNFVAK